MILTDETTDKRKILVADVAVGTNSLPNILGGSADFLIAVTIDEATEILKDKVDLIICAVHFDKSRIFDLLRMVKADAQTRHIPFLCFRDLNSALAPAAFQSQEISCRALGADEFIDLYDLRSRFGIETAQKRFRDVVIGSLNT